MWVLMCLPAAGAVVGGILAWEKNRRRDAAVYGLAAVLWFVAAVLV